MAEQFLILFCDSEGRNHELFQEDIVNRLRNEFPPSDLKFSFHYSQSLVEDYEKDYSGTCKRIGARSVRTWLKQGLTFDLVIANMDFERNIRMGKPETGLDIIKELCERTHTQSPWTRFIIITAYPETSNDRLNIEVAKLLESDPESFIKLSTTDAGINWAAVRVRMGLLLGKILSDRKHYHEHRSQLMPPDLYDVGIIHKDLFSK